MSRVSATRRRRDFNKSTTNIPIECRSANIVRDHAIILPDDATRKPDEIFGKDRWQRGAAAVSPLTRVRGSTMLFLLAFLPGIFTTHDWTPETCDAGSLGHRSRLHEYDTDLRRAGS